MCLKGGWPPAFRVPFVGRGGQSNSHLKPRIDPDNSALGFDYEKGRIDVSVHPFTGGSHPTDVRITTRYSDNWSESVSGTVHEVRVCVKERRWPPCLLVCVCVYVWGKEEGSPLLPWS